MCSRPRQNFFSPYFQPDFKSLAQIPAADGRTAQNIDVCLCHRGFKDFGSGTPFFSLEFQKCHHVLPFPPKPFDLEQKLSTQQIAETLGKILSHSTGL